MEQVEVVVTGMTCERCAARVQKALRRAGATRADVDWRRGRAVVEAPAIDEVALRDALRGTTYRVDRIISGSAWTERDAGAWDHDLVVIGSGAGAFAGAIRARDLGRRVLMIEHATTGGTCVNIGCIPSKSLLVDSERARAVGDLALEQAVARKAALVADLRQRKYIDLIDEYGIEFCPGHARILDAHTVECDGGRSTAQAILVATGARPAVPAIAGLDAAGYLTSTSALELTDPPASLAVLGAGAVGLELGQMLGNFGSRVTFLARRDVAPNGEPETSAALRDVLEDAGHRVLAPAVTTEVAVEGPGKVLRGHVDGEPFELRVDEILVAVGRTPNSDELDLQRVGVTLDEHGAIVIDERQCTSVASIFAAGDVTAQPRFVYVAAAAGAVAASNALDQADERLDLTALPQIIFTSPAHALAGVTEAQARAQGRDVETRVLPLSAIPRALVNGDARGLFKLVAEAGSGRLIGVSVLADGAPDVIQAAVLAIDRGMTVGELASTWAPYLAMAEGLKLAAQTFTRDVASLSCCAA